MGYSKMDLFCCGMYRSCSTWQYEIGTEVFKYLCLTNGPAEVQAFGYMTGPEYDLIRRAQRDRSVVRILKGHEGHHSYTNAMYRGRAMGLYAHRDIRDVIFSLMHKRRQSFQEIVSKGMIHQILVNDRFWRCHPQVLVQRYDDILDDPERAVNEIAEFLHIEMPAGTSAQLAQAYSKDANLKRTERLQTKLAEHGLDLTNTTNAEVYDQQTLLHWNHIRSGPTSWRSLASAQERMVMQRLLGPWLALNGYEADDLEEIQVKSDFTKSWRLDEARGFLRCHSREFSSAYHRWSKPLKRMLGLGAGEARSKALEKVAQPTNSA